MALKKNGVKKNPLKIQQISYSDFTKFIILIILFHRKFFLFLTGFELKEAELEEVTSVSGILNVSDDFLTAETRSKYDTYVPRVKDVKKDEWVDAYLHLKQKIDTSM